MSDQARLIYKFGHFQLEEAKYCLQKADGEKIPLGSRALDVLFLLVKNPGKVFKKEDLIESIWDTQVEEGSLSQCIHQIRKALGDNPKNPKYIVTRSGKGFQFVADVDIEQVRHNIQSDHVEEKTNNLKKGVHSDEQHVSLDITLPSPLSCDKVSIAHLPKTGSDLFGRDAELQLLYDVWENPSTNIITFIAWGGVGKTALVNHWVKRHLAREGFRGAEHVYGWSFYSQGTSERATSADLFIDQALRRFGGDELANKLATVSPWDKGEHLARLIRQARTLLILDGLEPLQHPPGPQEGELKDTALYALLVELAAQQPGLCVITTRERVSDLVEFENGTVIQHQLEHLSPQDGTQLLRSLGAKGHNNELEEAVKEYVGHALALTLLGSYLADVYGGDIRRRSEIESLEDDVRHGRHAERVMRAYEKWLGEGVELAVLRLLGLFDRPAEAALITALRAAPPIPRLTEVLQGLKERQWRQALAKLRRIKLLGAASESEPDVLDAHPLVREHFRQQVKRECPDAWREANNRLYEYVMHETKEYPDTIEDMSHLYAAVAYGCAAGRYQEAYDIYSQRIRRQDEFFNLHNLGAFGTDLAALYRFFEIPWKQPLASLNETSRAELLNIAGFDLRALGRLKESVQPMQAGLEMDIARGDLKNAAIAGGNLSELYLLIGNLPQALKLARQSVDLADRSGVERQRMIKRSMLADVLHQMGHTKEATATFQAAEAVQKEWQPASPFLPSFPGFLYCDLLLDQGQVQEVKERATLSLEIATRNQWLLIIALDNLSLARAWLLEAQQNGTDNIRQAVEFMHRAVDGLRQAGMTSFLPRGLLAQAALGRYTGDYERADRDLAEVLRLATRGGMGLHLADYHLESARHHLAQGNLDKARQHLATSREMIEAMGYHRRDNEVYELAEKVH